MSNPALAFEDAMLTVKDIQLIFACGKEKAYEIVSIPGFPAIRIGRTIRISTKALEKWLQDNEGKTIL